MVGKWVNIDFFAFISSFKIITRSGYRPWLMYFNRDVYRALYILLFETMIVSFQVMFRLYEWFIFQKIILLQ